MNKVAGYRVMIGKKQQDIANVLNISRQAYSEKERGKVPFNDKEKIILKKMFTVVNSNLTIDDLFF